MGLKQKLTKIASEWTRSKNETFTNHLLANFFRKDFKEDIDSIVKAFDTTYEVKASVGAGNWLMCLGFPFSTPLLLTQRKMAFIPSTYSKPMARVFSYLLSKGRLSPPRT